MSLLQKSKPQELILRKTRYDKAFALKGAKPVSSISSDTDLYIDGYRRGWEGLQQRYDHTAQEEAKMGFIDGQGDRLRVVDEHHELLEEAMTTNALHAQLAASVLTIKRVP